MAKLTAKLLEASSKSDMVLKGKNPADQYQKELKQAEEALKEIQKAIQEFKKDKEPNWADVGSASSWSTALRDISDRILQRGEYK